MISKRKKEKSALFYWIGLIATLLGELDSIYLLIYKLTGNNRMCIGSGACHDVNFSPYSEIYGIPISLLGVVAYLAIAAVLVLEQRLPLFQENGPLAVFGLSLAGVGFSAYLTYLELGVIHKVCPFCVVSAVCISIVFIMAIVRLVMQTTS
jgi:uncharacterized membrane protein